MGLVFKGERGATLIEAAIILPLLLFMVFSILELGVALKDFLTTDFAAKEGARVAALAGNDPDADCQIVQSIVAGYSATDIAKEALATGRGVAELVLEKGLLPAEKLAGLLRPEVVAGSGPALV